jgi:hydrogenase maturation protein HypF
MAVGSKRRRRVQIEVAGAVQGVGFRPFVHRLAIERRLDGWVRNTSGGVEIELEGDEPLLQDFLERLRRDTPPLAEIRKLNAEWLDPIGHAGFGFRPSEVDSSKTALVLPDVATCDECLYDVFDSGNRRYRYPFTNCTNCGPRFSIIESLPYDRSRTTMKRFEMCDHCRAEYEDPASRRFHAQPNACPACGPRLALWDSSGAVLAERDDALTVAIRALESGAIVAVKGLGGFHLFVDASRGEAVGVLRERKHRWEKPFAVMVPSLEAAVRICGIDSKEETLLRSAVAPIVIVRRAPGSVRQVCLEVAPQNPTLGLLLPSNPLHTLLLHEFGGPLVATSGNVSDEPIVTDEREVLDRLGRIADLFLVHDRPIVRPVDDSVVRVVAGRPMILRRARGYAPFPVSPARTETPVLAVGAQQKNTVALSGDLDTPAADANFRAAVSSLTMLYDQTPEVVACDLHPDYRSTRFAEETGLPRRTVQHHVAHVFACLAENELTEPALGISWDGTGLGTDGRIWGGEFFDVSEEEGTRRIAHLREFPLPGGECAAREPRRCALGVLWERLGEDVFYREDLAPIRQFEPSERELLRRGLDRNVNSPRTSSAGRLFDAVASLAGLRQLASFEGQAAMELEFEREVFTTDDAYPFALAPPEGSGRPAIVDWGPMLDALLIDVARSAPPGLISARFHNMLVEAMVAVATRTARRHVVLTGGCFQNAYLTESVVTRLRLEGFEPAWHRHLPPNDGGIAVGQLEACARPSAANFVGGA